MDRVKELINELGTLRGVPQFLFNDSIDPRSYLSVRKSVEEFLTENPDVKEIDFILQSPGGLADDAYRIIRTLRHNFETVNVIIPFWAKSAATLLALGATNIVLDEAGEFGPLDAQLGKARDDSPQYDRESALNDEHSIKRIETRFKEMYESMYIRLYEHKKINLPKAEMSKQLLEHLSIFYEPLLKQIDPYKLGEKRRKLDIGAHYARRILMQFSKDEPQLSEIRQFVDYLVDGCPDHGYVIDFDLVHGFLKNVYTSDRWGSAYKKILSRISMIFIEEDFDSFTEFLYIPAQQNNKKDVNNNDQQSGTQLATDSKSGKPESNGKDVNKASRKAS